MLAPSALAVSSWGERGDLRTWSGPSVADLAWRAAKLMPDNDEATAKVLNTAGSWLKKNDDKAADRFYQAIERRCPKTKIGQEAIKRQFEMQQYGGYGKEAYNNIRRGEVGLSLVGGRF